MTQKVQFSLLASGMKFYKNSIESSNQFECMKLHTPLEGFNCVELVEGRFGFCEDYEMVETVGEIQLFFPPIEK